MKLFVTCSIFLLYFAEIKSYQGCGRQSTNLGKSSRNMADNLNEENLGSYRRVVGGFVARRNQYPFMVSIRLQGYHTCGGAIIRNTWILTAAHCFEDKDDFINYGTIVVGTNTLHISPYSTTYPRSYRIRSIHPHHRFDTKQLTNDIALIRTPPLHYSRNVRPIPLNAFPLPPGTIITIPGWGDTAYDGDLSEHLKFVDLQVIPIKKCERSLSMPLSRSLMCGVAVKGQGSCNGDSGGPAIVGRGRLMVGVTAWGIKCASGYPEMFTRVEMYKDWIVDTMIYVERNVIFWR